MITNHKKFSNKLRIAVFLFLFAVYLLTYTPRINSSDGLAMFATAENMVRRGGMDIEQIRWMDLQQGTYGLDGLLYSRKGIGVPLAMLPLTWLGLITPWFGLVSTSLIFNALVTALTAVVLLAYLEILGVRMHTGAVVALTFGLGTLAWPYAKSLFSDPFAGLLLLTTAFTLLKFKQTHQLRYLFLAGLCLGWNVATRYAEALFLPVYGLLLLYYLLTIDNSKLTIDNSKKPIFPLSSLTLRAIIAFCLPILIIGLILLTFNFTRYGDPFNTGYLPNETFSGIWLDGIIGQLISPGRGLLIYCPILILSFIGLIPFSRRFPAEATVAVSVILIHLLLYGKWFMWHGGYAWGPRFMIPTLPFWGLFLAPVVAKAGFGQPGQQTQHKLLRIIFMLLLILSIAAQLLSVLIDFSPFQNSLLDNGLPLFARQTFFDPQYAALLSGWQFVSIAGLDLVWLWQGQFSGWLLALLLVNVGITGYYFKRQWQVSKVDNEFNNSSSPQPSSTGRGSTGLVPLGGGWGGLKTQFIPSFSTFITLIALLIYTHTLVPAPLSKIVDILNSTTTPNEAIIINNPAITTDFAELYQGNTLTLGLNHGGFPLPEDVVTRLNEITAQHEQIWWLPNWLLPHESGIEQILLQTGFKAHEETVEDQRLLLFAYPPELPVNTTIGAVDFANSIKLNTVAYPSQAVPNTVLPLELTWQTNAPLAEDYHIFIHLINAQGEIISQSDGQPAQWRRPTSTWQVEEMIIDRHALWIASDTALGSYQLRLGLYNPVDGQRLLLANGADAITDRVEIGD